MELGSPVHQPSSFKSLFAIGLDPWGQETKVHSMHAYYTYTCLPILTLSSTLQAGRGEEGCRRGRGDPTGGDGGGTAPASKGKAGGGILILHIHQEHHLHPCLHGYHRSLPPSYESHLGCRCKGEDLQAQCEVNPYVHPTPLPSSQT